MPRHTLAAPPRSGFTGFIGKKVVDFLSRFQLFQPKLARFQLSHHKRSHAKRSQSKFFRFLLGRKQPSLASASNIEEPVVTTPKCLLSPEQQLSNAFDVTQRSPPADTYTATALSPAPRTRRSRAANRSATPPPPAVRTAKSMASPGVGKSQLERASEVRERSETADTTTSTIAATVVKRGRSDTTASSRKPARLDATAKVPAAPSSFNPERCKLLPLLPALPAPVRQDRRVTRVSHRWLETTHYDDGSYSSSFICLNDTMNKGQIREHVKAFCRNSPLSELTMQAYAGVVEEQIRISYDAAMQRRAHEEALAYDGRL